MPHKDFHAREKPDRLALESEDERAKREASEKAERYLKNMLDVLFAARNLDGFHDILVTAYLTGNDGNLWRLVNRQTGRDLERVFADRKRQIIERGSDAFDQLTRAMLVLLANHSDEYALVPRDMLTEEQRDRLDELVRTEYRI